MFFTSMQFFLNIVLIMIYGSGIVLSLEFNKLLTGVTFSPYVKPWDGDETYSCVNKYTFSELKVMLEIVSTKFARLVTPSMDALDGEYMPQNTYYNNTCIIARTAEAAAVINAEQNQKILSVIIGIRNYDSKEGGERRTETEVKLAIEAYHVANAIQSNLIKTNTLRRVKYRMQLTLIALYLKPGDNIFVRRRDCSSWTTSSYRGLPVYAGTVEGFQISNVLSDTQSVISGSRWVDYLRNKTNDSHLLVGVIASVDYFDRLELSQDDIDNYKNTTVQDRVPTLNILAKLDFMSLKFFVDSSQAVNGPTENFRSFATSLSVYKNFPKFFEKEPVTMGYTGWENVGEHPFQNIDNMTEYWTKANKFAVQENVPMWFHEAFDNPWKTNLDTDSPYYGWWRLVENGKADNFSAYVENVLNPRNVSMSRSTITSINNLGTLPNTRFIWVWFSVAVIAGILIILILLIGFLKLYKMKKSLQDFVLSKQEIREFKLGSNVNDLYGTQCGLALQSPYDRSLEISKENLEIYWDKILGTGNFGTVVKASVKDRMPEEVALKTTKVGCSSTALKGILSEIKILAHLGRHPNIVSICGACTAELQKGKVYVALEFCAMGSLKNHLRKLSARKTDDRLDDNAMENMLRWSFEIAAGMEHIGLKGVVHADLATRNVLLSGSEIAKVSDFGLSRRLYEYDEYVKKQQEPLPWRWMSIESLKFRQFSCQSDVWSYGVTLWEIFSLGMEPYPGVSYNARFVDDLEKGLVKMKRPSEATPELYKLMEDCWCLQPDTRPKFSDLKTRISEMRRNENYDTFLDVKI